MAEALNLAIECSLPTAAPPDFGSTRASPKKDWASFWDALGLHVQATLKCLKNKQYSSKTITQVIHMKQSKRSNIVKHKLSKKEKQKTIQIVIKLCGDGTILVRVIQEEKHANV